MDRWWRGTESVLVVVGLGGTGKSTIVQRWLRDVAGETETGQLDGLLQFSLYEHGARSFRDFVSVATSALGAAFRGGDDVESLIEVLMTRRVLVVLDGAERLLREYAVAAPELVEEREPTDIASPGREVAGEEAWRFFIALASRRLLGRVVMTTRLMPVELEESETSARIDLGGLSAEQSVTLLRRLQIEGSDDELRRAAARFDGHPFTLARLANVLRADPASPGDVRRAPQYEDAINLRRRRHDIFDRAFDTLRPHLRQALFLMAAARGTISGADVLSLANSIGVRIDGTTFRDLEDEMWIDRDASGGVRLHSLARRWLAVRDPDSRRTHQTHADLWQARSESLDIQAVASNNQARLADLRPAIELVFHLARAGRPEDAYRRLDGELSAILAGRFSANSLRSELLLELFPDRDPMRLPALPDPQAQGSVLNSLANDLALLGQPLQAVHALERAVALARSGSRNSLAVRLGNLALTQIRIGQLAEANANLRMQLSLGRDNDDGANVVVALQELARLEALCGRYGEAVALLEDADSIVANLLNGNDEVLSRVSPIGWSAERKRGYLQINRGALAASYRALVLLLSGKDARNAARAAADLANQSHEPRAIARAETVLGTSLAMAGEVGEARKLLADLLARVRTIGILDMEAEVLTAIARAWVPDDRMHAGEFARLSRQHAERNGGRLQLADALLVAAGVAAAEERLELAEQARSAAWCDGPPFTYAAVVAGSEAMIEQGRRHRWPGA